MKLRAQHQQRQERHEDDHLGDEHALAPEVVGQASETDGADQDAEQAGGADQAVLRGTDAELARDQRQRDARHEDDEALEELSGRRERPDAPLHRGHRRVFQARAVRPDRQLVDVVLNGFATRFAAPRGERRCASLGYLRVHDSAPRRPAHYLRQMARAAARLVINWAKNRTRDV